MQFKTAADIRAQKKMQERARAYAEAKIEREAREAQERANRKYAAIARAAEKREQMRQASKKPAIIVDRSRVIVSPLLQKKMETRSAPSPQKEPPKQIWDDSTKEWKKP